jgi:hypothetical protein
MQARRCRGHLHTKPASKEIGQAAVYGAAKTKKKQRFDDDFF